MLRYILLVIVIITTITSNINNIYAISITNIEYAFYSKFGSFGSGNGQFYNPYSVAYDPNNDRIIVSDTMYYDTSIFNYLYNNRVQLFNGAGSYISQFSKDFIPPAGVSYDPNNDRIIVANPNHHKIQVFDSTSNFLFEFGTFGSDNGMFDHPHGVAYDPNNDRIIVADTYNHRVQVFDSSGNFLFKFGTLGSNNGEFTYPHGVAYDPNNDRIIVADTYNNRVQVFDSSGNFLFKFGTLGSNNGEFTYPHGVAYDPNNDRIIVADTYNNRVQVFDSSGNFLFKFGTLGSNNGEFTYPHGVAYDPNNDRIIVADTVNHRIQIFSTIIYSLTLYEGISESDGVINLGDSITAKATTKNNNIVNVKFTWIDPSNNIANTNTVNIVSGEASDTYTPNQAGTWKVKAEFSDGTVIIKELNISFNVLPESIVGAIAIISSILGILAYRYRRII